MRVQHKREAPYACYGDGLVKEAFPSRAATAGCTTRSQLLQHRQLCRLHERGPLPSPPQPSERHSAGQFERARTPAVKTRTELLQSRRQESLRSLLHGNDVLPDLDTIRVGSHDRTFRHKRCKTSSQLRLRRQREAMADSVRFMPMTTYGVHRTLVSNFENRYRESGEMWYEATRKGNRRPKSGWAKQEYALPTVGQREISLVQLRKAHEAQQMAESPNRDSKMTTGRSSSKAGDANRVVPSLEYLVGPSSDELGADPMSHSGRDELAFEEPLYSSFTPDNVFPSAKSLSSRTVKSRSVRSSSPRCYGSPVALATTQQHYDTQALLTERDSIWSVQGSGYKADSAAQSVASDAPFGVYTLVNDSSEQKVGAPAAKRLAQKMQRMPKQSLQAIGKRRVRSGGFQSRR